MFSLASRFLEYSDVLPIIPVTLLLGLGLLMVGVIRWSSVVRAGSSERHSLAPELLALPLFASLVAIASVGSHSAVSFFQRARSTDDPAEYAVLLARGISNQQHAVAAAVVVGGIAAVLGTIGLILLVDARRRAAPKSRGSSWPAEVGIGLQCAGILVLLVAAGFHSWDLSRIFQAVAAADPSERAHLMRLGLEEARGTLIVGAYGSAGLIGLGLAAMASAAFTAGPGGPSSRTLGLASGLLLASGGIGIDTWPFAAQNAVEIPEPSPLIAKGAQDASISLPEIEGPDMAPRSATIELSPNRLTLEGFEVEQPSELTQKLNELKRVEQMFNRGAELRLGFWVDRSTPAARLLETMAVAQAEGFETIYLLFQTELPRIEGPLLSSGPRFRTTAAQIGTEQASQAIAVDADEAYSEVAKRVVAARRRSEAVRLVAAKQDATP